MNRRRSLLVALAAAGLCLAAAPAQAGPASTDVDQLTHDRAPLSLGTTPTASARASVAPSSTQECGPISVDTVLTEERLACWDGVIDGDGITVDLNGLTVERVVIDGHDVVLRNGTVDPQGNMAIFVLGSDALLDRLTVQNGSDFVVEAGHRTTIRDSVFQANTGVAVDQYFGSYLTVENSTFRNNDTAVSIQSGRHALIENNRFEDNRRGVNVWDEDLGFASDTTIRKNRFVGNDIGVRIDGYMDASGTLIEHNTIRNSAHSGILVMSHFGPGDHGVSDEPSPGGAADTVIRRNVIHRSGDSPQVLTVCGWDEDECTTATADDGITVIAADLSVLPSMEIAGNKTMHNAGYGIEADGVTDGGKNVAVRNGAGSCIGVRCRPGSRID